jgi:MoxR-like ATPase
VAPRTKETRPTLATQQTEAITTRFAQFFDAISANIQRAIQGKSEVVDLVLLCLVSEGHLLIEDVPGVGKTSLAKALAKSLDTSFGRMQFTPDLLPSDVVGVTVWNRSDSKFEFRPGPIFASIVLGDEINRAHPRPSRRCSRPWPKVVTVDNETYRLGPPFMVIATAGSSTRAPIPPREPARPLPHACVGRLPGSHGRDRRARTHGNTNPLDDIVTVATAPTSKS